MLVLDISTRPRKSKTHLATPLQTPVQGSDQTRLAPMKQRPGGIQPLCLGTRLPCPHRYPHKLTGTPLHTQTQRSGRTGENPSD